MKEQPFYKKGIGHPLQQTETNDLLYIDQPLHQNGTLDPLRGEKDKKTDKYTHYTDPSSGTQGKLDSGRSYAQAYKIAKEKGLSPEGESQSDYTKFAKWQLGSYRDTGVWKSREDYASEFESDKTARNGNETISSGGGRKPEKGLNIERHSVNKPAVPEITASGDPSELSKPESITPESTKSPSKGYIQAYEKGKGFSGKVLDKEVVGQLGKKELNAYARAQKKKALSLGATRREARAHKMDIKALGHYASAGETLTERDAQGNIVRQSDTEGLGIGKQVNMAGKARKKGAKFTRRANRLRHRMKDYEGHNLRENEIGGQYYGDKAKFNQDPNFGAHDQRNARARAVGGSATMNAKTTSPTPKSLLENEAMVDTTKLGDTVKKLRKKHGLTSSKEIDESIKNIGTA